MTETTTRGTAPTDTASARLAACARALTFDAIPGAVVGAAKDHLLDAIGVGLAAASLPATRGHADALRALGCRDESTALGLAGRWPAPSAALYNGTLVHSLEYDDTHIASVVHGSSVVAATALALAEQVGASGRALLSAYVLGWEAFIRLGLAAPGRFQARGFQVTAVGGSSIAALVASTLLGLDEAKTRSAIGITASQASGTFEALADGSSVKAMNPGWAAHAGVVAALLARGGMTGPATVYEGRFGLFGAYGGDRTLGGTFREQLATLGRVWHLPEAALKAFPCCHYIHPFLECARAIRQRVTAPAPTTSAATAGAEERDEQALDARGIERIDCFGPAGYETVICDPWDRKQRPANGYEAKFSLPYCVAAMLLRGRVDVDAFLVPQLDREALALAPRAHWSGQTGTDFPRRFPARLRIAWRDGRVEEASVADVHGSPTRPMPRAELERKFTVNAARTLRDEAVRELAAAVDGLDHARTLADLSAALSKLRSDT